MWLGQSYTLVADYIDQYSTVVYALIALAIIVVLVLFIRRSQKRKAATSDSTTDSKQSQQADASQLSDAPGVNSSSRTKD